MLPLLQCIADGDAHRVRDVADRLAKSFELTEEELSKKLPSGQQSIFTNRVAWSKSHLKMAGLIENPSRGVIRLSDTGRLLLDSPPSRIDIKYLADRYPSYVEFRKKVQDDDSSVGPPATEEATPKEQIDLAYKKLRNALAKDLLDRVKASSPTFFEDLVVHFLVAMGYGGTLADAGQRIGRSGDGGVDGIIKEDRLGLDLVCIQAKRWKETVGRPIVQAFVGSMDYYKAKKGVLITTSNFTADAQDYIRWIEAKRVVLIDGEMLADYMIDLNVGVNVLETYQVKRVDYDFFNEEED